MSEYLHLDRQTVSEEAYEDYYNEGYVLTRLGKGVMDKTRSLRIKLQDFRFNSENRRILKKTEGLTLTHHLLPLDTYSWEIHKMGKNFYTQKFGEATMSASKIKELFQNQQISNMNSVFSYTYKGKKLGYALCYVGSEMRHYAYPFYDLSIAQENPNVGMGMILKAIEHTVKNHRDYFYLGSVTTEASLYKLQFRGIEWFDEQSNHWSRNEELLKERIRETSILT